MWSSLAIFNLELYLPLMLGTTLLLKTVIFMRYKTQSWKLSHFIYFDYNHINGSSNIKTLTAKKVQNILSKLVFTVALLTLVQILVKSFVANY